VQTAMVKTTVYFDGSCPLCRAEIGHYRREDDTGALAFVDVSDTVAPLPSGLTRQHAMERFHVLEGNGQLLSGAVAFVSVWRRLPRWRWAARIAALPGASTALEVGYRLFLPARPFISRLFGTIERLGRLTFPKKPR
jgi:predicted DCC family thiol-disulfide oxidoreductase YuxK